MDRYKQFLNHDKELITISDMPDNRLVGSALAFRSLIKARETGMEDAKRWKIKVNLTPEDKIYDERLVEVYDLLRAEMKCRKLTFTQYAKKENQ